MSFSQIATSVSILSSGLKGYQAISLTNFVSSAASLIASGSAIEIANAFFLADGNITPNATSWTLVGTGNTAYIILTPSGSAGVQVLTAAYTDTAPVWNDSKQGWYQSAASLVRYVAGVFKAGTSSYEPTWILSVQQEPTFVAHHAGTYKMLSRDNSNSWAYTATAPTKDAVFEILKPFLPTVNDEMCIFGSRVTSAATVMYHLAFRASAGSVYLQGTYNNVDGSLQGYQQDEYNDGDSSSYNGTVFLAW